MTAKQSLDDRLKVLHDKINQAQERLSLTGILTKDYHASSQELKARYKLLKKQLDDDTATEESHGHHVGDLETAVSAWLNSLDLDY